MSARRERHSTYSDQWYQVENLTPALRPDVNIRRQTYWGTPWYIISEPDNNTHFRLAREGYFFVSLLDGKRSMQDIWEQCQDVGEGEALTQNEAIALLGRLHSAGLLLLEMPADTDSLLRRQQERRLKKLSSTLSSFLFLRIPLWAPDAFFSRFQHAGSWAFKPVGFGIWLIMLAMAVHALVVNWGMFVAEARYTFNPANIGWVYLVVIIAKVVHECGHAFACKYFTARDGLAGDIHSMGIMLLLFAPVPYIDVSSSVQIRSRWARAAIGLAGVYCELFLAFVATLIWANTAEGTSLHLLARNCVIITSVTTLLFNINPLLRFDGYFVFSDLLSMPNLYQRSQSYVIYLFKKYVLGVNKAATVVSRKNEKIIYPVYAVAALSVNAEPVFVPATAETGNLPDFTNLPQDVLDRTTIAYICSPANPQGAIADAAYWQTLIALAEKHDFIIFADECYSEIYRDTPPVGALQAAKEMGADPDRVLAFHSLSKRSNLAGLRSGFCAGGTESIKRVRALRAYAGAPLPEPLQAVATAAWNDEAHVTENRALYAAKFKIADDIFADVQNYDSPKGGFFLWLPVDNGEAAAVKLWAETGVRVLPGAYLSRDVNGANPGDKFIRVALVAPTQEMQRGLTLIRDCLYD